MFKKIIYNAHWMALALTLSLMIPVVVLTFTEHYPFWVALAGILLPLGVYAITAALSRRSGRMVWWSFPVIFISAFQIVLSYLFGNSVIATDMFLNLKTTNPSEANELLCNIYPSIIAVCVMYLPLLWFATKHLSRRIELPQSSRRGFFLSGAASLILGTVALIVAGQSRDVRSILRNDIFPLNAIYNMGIAIDEARKIDNYATSSQGFTYQALREVSPSDREIYVLVIGEAARAANWQLFGYNRTTNPRLAARDDIALFSEVTTQSNTTHKSVPMILSSIHTSQHDELYRRKGLPALFNEVDFKTYFFSNQAPQGAMVDNLAHDADVVEYMDFPHHDYQLVEAVKRALEKENSERILFILHTYGSHFSYHQRYPREMAKFLPDDDVAIHKRNAEMIRNAYDNSILYTDYVLSELIKLLSEQDACTAMYYCADHGEDLFDTEQGRFLHSSPTTTYYQLHVASIAWFSPRYCELFGRKVEAAKANRHAPATTYSVFHTMADIASIRTPYLNERASLVNPYFDHAARRYYLNDHNRAVPLDEQIGIDDEQRELFRQAGVRIE